VDDFHVILHLIIPIVQDSPPAHHIILLQCQVSDK
jgi:hypothetical protein